MATHTSPHKYRKLPVVIEAIQWDGTNDEEVESFVQKALVIAEPDLYIETLEGKMVATIGDYIIKGVKGEFYPCKPDIFAATYEQVEDGADVTA